MKKSLLVEAIIYRIGSVLVSFSVVWIMTGDITMTLGLTAVLFVVNMAYYMTFRKLWSKK